MNGKTVVVAVLGLVAALALLAGCTRPTSPPSQVETPEAIEPGAEHVARVDPAAIGWGYGYQPPRAIRGKVTAADSLLGLAILNVGQRHGVRRNHAFIAYRGDRYVGRLVVDEVLPEYCAAHYSREMQSHIRVGDDVTTRLVVGF